MTGNTDRHLLVTDTLKKGRVLDKKKMSVSGVTTISLMQHNTSPLHKVDQTVDCGLRECCPTPLQWLCKVAEYWRELECIVVHVNPEHAKHAQCVTCLVSMQALEELGHFQELCTDPCDMGPCIIMLKHEVIASEEWHDIGPQDLIMVSLCIKVAIDKMQLCLLSVAYACPLQYPTEDDVQADELP